MDPIRTEYFYIDFVDYDSSRVYGRHVERPEIFTVQCVETYLLEYLETCFESFDPPEDYEALTIEQKWTMFESLAKERQNTFETPQFDKIEYGTVTIFKSNDYELTCGRVYVRVK